MTTVLIIDDDDQARGFVREALKRAGYAVLEAADGEQGVRLVREAAPALVVTDILMPNKEGLEVIRELREHSPALPVIAMSGGSQRMAPDAVLRVASFLGARRVLFKPFAMHDLLAAVQAALEPPPA